MIRAWSVWGFGVLAYVVAVFDRSSLGVAGIEAQQRFGATATQLSLFAVLQLAVYAAMQVPVGVLVDRFGSRRVIAGGALLMAAGQLALALAGSVPEAVAARVLVGAGDAMTFISVLRLVPRWFTPRLVPMVSQLTALFGQLGQVAAAIPLVAVLHAAGWAPVYAGSAALSVLIAVLVAAAMRDSPPGTVAAAAPGWAEVRRQLRDAWREPGTRLGLWTHFATPFSGMAFVLLWGYPFLVTGHGLSPAAAGALLSVVVLVSITVGPPLGELTSRWPRRRLALVLAVVGASAAVWALVLLWPGRTPMALLVLLVAVLGTNSPGSVVAFDFARTANPPARLGSATGIVNVGGFTASLLAILGIGAVLDLTGDFRAAFAVQYPLWALGVVAAMRAHRATLRTPAPSTRDHGVVVAREDQLTTTTP